MTNLSKLFDSLQKNIVFVLVSLVLMAVVYFIAFGFEKLIEKKNNIKFSSEKTRVNKMVIMAMLAAISVILMYFEFPLTFIAPSFYEIDLSEVPVLIGSFLLGPCAGVVIEAVKVILKICIKGTTTAFVGDFANFILGCFFAVPASVVSFSQNKEKSGIGTCCWKPYTYSFRRIFECILSASKIFRTLWNANRGFYCNG